MMPLLAMAVAAAAVAAEDLKPWSANSHATDARKSHVEEIAQGKHAYTVVQGGTMDGRSCRSPMGCGLAREGALLQAWESNRSVRMENAGAADVVNPWLSNGRNTFRTVEEIVATAVAPGMTDAEKAFALWFQEIRYRHHSGGDNNELGDPVKVFNVYGQNTCGNDSICLATLWRAAGIKAAPARALGHCISQAFYDGRWHFYDGDMHCVYLLRDNETIAGEQDIVRDHDLIKRTHSKGILFPDTWWDGPEMGAMYFYEGAVTGERGRPPGSTMNMVLRPGEAIVWRWGHLTPLKYHGAQGNTPTYPDTICNGLWEYRPDFSKETWKKGAEGVEGIVSGADGLAAEEGKTGTATWAVRSPYVFVGGRLEAEGDGAEFSFSADGKAWRPVKDNSLDACFPVVGPALYAYKLRCQLKGTARLRRLAILNDLQMAPLALPEMGVGENAFTYTDQSAGERKVRVTHAWVERSEAKPPQAPTAPVSPPDGGEADGTDVVFTWAAAKGADGESMGDYQFELSPRADMRFPLSMDFYKLVSRTADAVKEKGGDGKEKVAVKTQYTLPRPGLLTPDRRYYWRVRAMSDKGVWGPWSGTWSFTPRGPACPLEVAVGYDAASGAGTLRWKANPAGRPPARYRVYGSDEKGFTASDERYQSSVGVTKREMADWTPWFPANFIAETAATELAVLGREVRLPAANKAFYRVVAVDDRGKRSGPSDYAAAPRPVIFSAPVTEAQAGAAYRYAVCATRSIGDLGARMQGGNQVNGYFDIEKLSFKLEQGPAWLAIDEATGVLTGTPGAAASADVAVTVTLTRDARQLDEKALAWGNEKVLSTTREQVGTATQTFVITVR